MGLTQPPHPHPPPPLNNVQKITILVKRASLMIQHRQEYDDEEEYYYYDYEPESSCPPGELKVQVILPFRLSV